MERGSWIRRLTDSVELYDENVASQPLIEICGTDRVMIEYHLGVSEYTPQRISVRVKHGHYSILGQDLSLCRMCNQQLLIRGKIRSVEIWEGRG